MHILKGKPVADAILQQVAANVAPLHQKPTLAIVLVGNDEGSLSYIQRKQAAAEKVGISCILYHLPEETTQHSLINLMEELNADDSITGYIVQLPLPEHIQPNAVFHHIAREKDVDGFHPYNIGELFLNAPEERYLPAATSRAVMKLLEYYNISLAGTRACILGKGPVVGRPLALELLHAGSTVTVCHSRTKNMKEEIARADIVISAVGIPHFVDPELCKEQAILIDVGFSKKNGLIYGDIQRPTQESSITGFVPVPGGIGPITVAVLMENVVKAAKMQYAHRA